MTLPRDACDSKTFADLTLTVCDSGPATVVELSGEFDAYTAYELRRHLALYPVGRFVHVVMDLRRLGFVDSAGIAVIVALSKQAAKRAGTLRLVIPECHLLVKLRRMGLVKLWPIHPDVDSALEAVMRVEQEAARSTPRRSIQQWTQFSAMDIAGQD